MSVRVINSPYASYLTPQPPSLRGQGERFETPLSVSGRVRGGVLVMKMLL